MPSPPTPLDPHSAALLARLGPPRGAMTAAELARDRAAPPDETLAGTPEPVALRAELVLPLEQACLRARLYRNDLERPAPIMLWLHGGGFCAGSIDDVDTACAAIARRGEAIVVALDYRLAPEHPFPAALSDTVRALGWLGRHGGALGGDGRIVVGGQSAGGNLAAAAALLAREESGPRIDAQIVCYPALDFELTGRSHGLFDGVLLDRGETRWFYEQYLAGTEPTPLASPLLAASLAELPPALVLTAGADPLRDDGRSYARRLEADGVPIRHVEYAGAVHAFLNFPGALPYAWDAIDEIARYLRDRFPPTPRSAAALQHVTSLYERSRSDDLRALYGATLGLAEKPAPDAFREAGIVWFAAGDGERELHFVPADDAELAVQHLCLQVDDLDRTAAQLAAAGFEIEWSAAIKNRPRFFFTDPFGNVVEVVAPTGVYA